jgi:apolipoprotein N-acyltransferase
MAKNKAAAAAVERIPPMIDDKLTVPWPLLGRLELLLAAETGWRRRLILTLLGALGALALPPVHVVPAFCVGLWAIVWSIERAPSSRAAFAAGWWVAFGYFLAGLYWIASALLVDPVKFGWMIPFIVGGLSGVLALFVGAAAAVVRRLRLSGVAAVLALAAAWVFFEWVRSWLLSGFPWNLAGYVWAFSDGMNQFAALAGIWGLSLVTIIGLGLPALLARPVKNSRSIVLAVASGLLLLLAIWIGGEVRLSLASPASTEGLHLRIVQADIAQTLKNDSDAAFRNVLRQVELTRATPGGEAARLVLWPEAAVPFLIEREPMLRKTLASIVPAGGYLLTGAPRGEPKTGPLDQVWNSLVVLDDHGDIRATFDKFHLVPLGEYVPLRHLFPFISKVTPGGMDFTAGAGPTTIRLPGLPAVGPVICYEVIFPHAVVNEADRPDWIVNLTNDGWFGMTSGPYQHFASARLRAVEEGLPLVRAANTGISGIVDPYGRVIKRLGLGNTGVIDGILPQPLTPTPYARGGNWIVLALGLIVALLALVCHRRRI